MKEVRCEFRRGGRVEAVHRAAVAVVEGTRTIFRRGPVDDPVWLRSCAKPFQTLTVAETGAVERFGFGAPELSVMSGSHGGDAAALRAVRAILKKAGLRSSALRCGAHPPVSAVGLRALHRSGRLPAPLHNNCSGKHAGMLAAARHLGAPLGSYLDPDHPLQRANLRTVARFTGVSPRKIPLGVDGCGAPTYRVPLRSMARAMAGFCGGDGPRRWIREAMMRHPAFVGPPCAVFMPAAPGRIVTKVGAEGLYVCGIVGPEAGIAAKILDGNHRATLYLMVAVIRKLGLLSGGDLRRLARVADPVLRNHAGRIVGDVRVFL